MGVRFPLRIDWPKNDLLLPRSYLGVQVPTGVTSSNVRAPNFVDVAQMTQLTRANAAARSASLTRTEGLVTSDLTVRFASPASQWRRSAMPGTQQRGSGPYQFQFTGGDVILNLDLGIYIATTGKPDSRDSLSAKIFAVLYEHELLHVLDALDIITNWLPSRLNSEPTVSRYLVQAQPYTYGKPSQTTAQVEREFQQHVGNTIEIAIFNVWATESNRRQQLRDSPAQYQIVRDKLAALRSAQINRP